VHSYWLIEVLGPLHDIHTESLGKTIQGHLQLAASTESVEKAGLGMIIATDEIVRDETNQAEWPTMINMFEKISGCQIKSLGYVGRLTQSVPTGYQLKVSRLELQTYTEGKAVLFSQTSADHIG
jgi:hypothetical protein